MKKFILGMVCGMALTATTAVYAADTIQTYLFPVKFEFNGESKPLDEKEYVVLNHNGHAYVPLRYAAESMGKLARYNEETRTISIDDTNLSQKLILDSKFLTAASQGKLSGIEFGIGASRQEVLSKWGEPHKTGSWQTAYSQWFDYYYFFSNPNERVGAIRVAGHSIPYSAAEVKKALGTPDAEGIDEVAGTGYYVHYTAGEYELFFLAGSQDSAVNYMTFKKK
ncbi:DUF4309 domain-containing protein [Paenibacillus sp. GCM10023248]|uniref:DUF4309 domain-containing protein n=1 Tax=Bacillales TaxID=1385 RepID=UPI00237908F1|nr:MULTISPECIES: DUF4309 domain-containing protein [Bacillales]MDD9268171.1 DUF4309 domain-containing protein [Paenibacillus sp. MAHUQ-63]MDR6879850.1 hypothetical protein [Bacillus sp. 3255]